MEYTPTKIESNQAIFAVNVKPCPKCGKDMVVKPDESWSGSNTFSYGCNNGFEAQAKRGGFVIQSTVRVDDKYICEECKDSGLIDFECCLCGKRYPTTEIHNSYGYSPDYLCQHCYETTPAKTWNEKVEELREEHRYDFE